MVSPIESAGGRYVEPISSPEYPPDAVPAPPLPRDSSFEIVPNPDGSEIGPMYQSPEGKQWLEENVYDQGWIVDWGSRDILDPNTGEIKGTVPTSVPRMI